MITYTNSKLENIRGKLHNILTQRQYNLIICNNRSDLDIAYILLDGKTETYQSHNADGLEVHSCDVEFKAYETKSKTVEIITFKWLEKWNEELGDIEISNMEVL